MTGVEFVPVNQRHLRVGHQTLAQYLQRVLYLVRHGHGGQPGEQLREQLVILKAGQADCPQRRVELPQCSVVLLVHLRADHEHGVLDGEKVTDVHNWLVHLGGLGDMMKAQQLCQIADDELLVVLETDHRQHDLQPN